MPFATNRYLNPNPNPDPIPNQVMPFATNRYLNLLRGNASNAWQNGGGATV